MLGRTAASRGPSACGNSRSRDAPRAPARRAAGAPPALQRVTRAGGQARHEIVEFILADLALLAPAAASAAPTTPAAPAGPPLLSRTWSGRAGDARAGALWARLELLRFLVEQSDGALLLGTGALARLWGALDRSHSKVLFEWLRLAQAPPLPALNGHVSSQPPY
jgi:hypothetical protein